MTDTTITPESDRGQELIKEGYKLITNAAGAKVWWRKVPKGRPAGKGGTASRYATAHTGAI